jgi:hypothetical protein
MGERLERVIDANNSEKNALSISGQASGADVVLNHLPIAILSHYKNGQNSLQKQLQRAGKATTSSPSFHAFFDDVSSQRP